MGTATLLYTNRRAVQWVLARNEITDRSRTNRLGHLPAGVHMTTDNAPGADAPRKGLFRERGTLRIVIIAIVVGVVWYAYSAISTQIMLGVKWPGLSFDSAGLSVLGLHDRDLPGNPRDFVAIESNKSWQFRRPDDVVEEKESSGSDEPEKDDRPVSAAIQSRAAQGGIVTVDEIIEKSPVVLNGKCFSSAEIEEHYEPFRDVNYYSVHVALTGEGSSRYWQYSRDHEKESLVFVIDRQAITCPKMEHMNTSSLTIEPIWVKADAQKLADVINKKR